MNKCRIVAVILLMGCAVLANPQMEIENAGGGSVAVEIYWPGGFNNTLEIYSTTNLAGDAWQFACERAAQMKLKDFVKPPEETEHVDENASLSEAIHQLVLYPHHSLLVTRQKKIVGILRLSDVFATICDRISNCRN